MANNPNPPRPQKPAESVAAPKPTKTGAPQPKIIFTDFASI